MNKRLPHHSPRIEGNRKPKAPARIADLATEVQSLADQLWDESAWDFGSGADYNYMLFGAEIAALDVVADLVCRRPRSIPCTVGIGEEADRDFADPHECVRCFRANNDARAALHIDAPAISLWVWRESRICSDRVDIEVSFIPKLLPAERWRAEFDEIARIVCRLGTDTGAEGMAYYMGLGWEDEMRTEREPDWPLVVWRRRANTNGD